MNDDYLTASVKLATMAQMSADAARYAMAASVGREHWVGQARDHVASLKLYTLEVERLLSAGGMTDEPF